MVKIMTQEVSKLLSQRRSDEIMLGIALAVKHCSKRVGPGKPLFIGISREDYTSLGDSQQEIPGLLRFDEVPRWVENGDVCLSLNDKADDEMWFWEAKEYQGCHSLMGLVKNIQTKRTEYYIEHGEHQGMQGYNCSYKDISS